MPHRSAKEAAKEYLDYSTAHGLGRVKNSPYLVLQVCWVIAILGAVGTVGFQVFRLIQKWNELYHDGYFHVVEGNEPHCLRNPVSTHVEIETAMTVRFPAVTFCNINPVQFSLMKNNTKLLQIVYEAGKTWNVNMSSFGLENYTGADFEDLEPLPYDDDVFSGASELLKLRLSALRDDEIEAMSQFVSDFIVHCNFAGYTCVSSSLRRFRSYEYGICFTFGASDKLLESENYYDIASPGQYYGLDLILNVDQPEYIPFVTPSAGVAVVVHHPGSHPYEDVEAITIPTGFESSIAVHMEKEMRLPGSTERCQEDSAFSSFLQCQQDCVDFVIEGECGCSTSPYSGVYYYYDDGDDDDDDDDDGDDDVAEEASNETIRTCSNYNDSLCIEQAKNLLGVGLVTCEVCKQPCFQRKYVKKLSSTTWPANNYQPVLDNILKTWGVLPYEISQRQATIRENLVKLRVFLSTFNIQSTVEEYSYTNENFVSDIGGQLGLWIGFSVLSLCEIVELVILLFASCRQRKLGHSDRTITVSGKNRS